MNSIFLKRLYRIETALIYRGKRVSGSELVLAIECYEKYFEHLNIKEGDSVGIFLENRPEMITLFLALAGLGAISVLLDSRASFIEDFLPKGIKHLVTSTSFLNKPHIRDLGIGISNIDIIGKPYGVMKKRKSKVVLESFPVLCLLSSGSSGKPKTIYRTWSSLLLEAENVAQRFEFRPGDRLYCTLPFFHSYMFDTCLLPGLFAGAAIVVDSEFSPARMLKTVKNQKITVLPLTPSHYRMLVRYGSILKESLATVRLCLSAGAPLSQADFDRFLEVSGKPIYQIYGTSETGPISTTFPDYNPQKGASVGTPMAHVEVKIRQEFIRLPASLGRIQVKSPCLGSYMLHPKDHKQWFFTGDLGYFDDDGYIFLTGRSDDIVSVAGEKVSLKEVEKVLLKHPFVRDVVVVQKDHSIWGNVLEASVSAGETLSEKELLDHCRQYLGSYKIPRRFRFVQKIRRNSMGKIKAKRKK